MLSLAINQTQVDIGLAALDGRALFFNQTMQQILGYSGEELQNINVRILFQDPQEFDQPPPPHPLRWGLTEYVLRTGNPQRISREKYQELITSGNAEPMINEPVDWLGVPLITP